MPADLTDAREWTRRHLLAHLAAPGPTLALEAVDTRGRWELSGDSEPIVLSGPLAEITAYLTGRAHKLTTTGGDPAPTLGPWL